MLLQKGKIWLKIANFSLQSDPAEQVYLVSNLNAIIMNIKLILSIFFYVYLMSFTSVGYSQNMINLVNPPTTVTVNEMVNITISYNNTENADAYVLVRFKSPSGVQLGQALTQVAPGQGTETLQVQAPANAGSGYSYQAQLLELTWGGLAEDIVNNISVETSGNTGNNSIDLVNPPTTVTIHEMVDIPVSYNNAENTNVYVLVRFKSPSGVQLGQAFTQVAPGQGTEILQVQAPANAGSGYSYQAQLLELTWGGLAEDIINNITVETSGNTSGNSIDLISPPTTVTVNEMVDINVSYNNTENADAYVLVRFKSPSGVQLGQAFTQVAPGQGTETLQIQAPANAGGGYSYQAQLLELTWGGLAEYIVNNITVETSGNTSENSINLINPPTTVTINEMVDINVSYNNTENADAYVLVRFKSPSGVQLGQAFAQVAPGQGTEILQIQAPANAGSGYSYQAQLLELTWGGLAEDIVNNITVEENGNTSNEMISLINWPASIASGESYDVTVSYDVGQNSIIYVQVFDQESPNATGNWNKIAEGWENVGAGVNNVTINNLLVDGTVGSSNRLEVLLFYPTSQGWGNPVTMNEVFVNVSGEYLFGEMDASDPNDHMRYYNRNLECNGETYNGGDANDGMDYDRTLSPVSNVYRSNWWVNAAWKGPIKTHYGEDDESGSDFWVEWQNLETCADNQHAEFDIRVEKSNLSTTGPAAGFPSRIGDITGPLNCSFTGAWTAGSKGRCHINMTVWVYNTLDLKPDDSANRCDIIIHSWDNSGDLKRKYEENFVWVQPEKYTYFNKIGTVTSNNITYDVLRTMPGGYGEGASYNLLPLDSPREFLTEFPTNTINSEVDVNKILQELIELEAANGPDIVDQPNGPSYTADLLTEDWGLHVMEWTVTGQSGELQESPTNSDEYVYVPPSMGRFTFEDYFIPNPCSSNPIIDCSLSVADPDVVLTDQIELRSSSSDHFIVDGNFADYTIKIINAQGQVVSDYTGANSRIAIDLSTIGTGLRCLMIEHITHPDLKACWEF